MSDEQVQRPGADGESDRASPARWLNVTASGQFLDWLAGQGLSLAFTTYQAGKLLFLGLKEHGVAVFERTFDRCMGLCVTPDTQTCWLSSRFQLWRFQNMLPPRQTDGEFDRVYVPRVGYTTGEIDVHDLAVDATGRIVFVNTLFSCLATVSDKYNFEPLWKPPFVTRLAAEDRCHLNGLALRDGVPTYVSLCSPTDSAQGWRDVRSDGGCVIDVTNNEIVVEGLAMPHSPRWVAGRLWLLEAGSGWLGYVDPERGHFERVAFCGGFARGLAIIEHWAIVGLSLPRHEPTFQGLPLETELERRAASPQCGLAVVDLRSGDVVHWVHVEGQVRELYDVVVLTGVRRAKALGFATDEIQHNVWFQDGDLLSHWKGAARQ